MKKGKKRIIIGCILIALQLLSLLGSLSSGFEFNLSFNNFYIFLYDLIFLCTYFFVGIIGLVLLILGLVARNKSIKNDSMINEKDNLVEEKKSEDDTNSVIGSAKEYFESREPEIETTSSKNEIIDNICKKCGNIISNEEKFCSRCGKKVKKQPKTKDTTAIKKTMKRIAIITITAIIVLCVIGVVIASYTLYIDKQNSYDVTTSSKYSNKSVEYAYEIENSAGEKLSDILYMDENHFMRVLIHGDVVYVSDKGIYEIGGETVIMRNDKGEEVKYLMKSGCLIEEDFIYDSDEIPRKDTFYFEANKEHSNILTNIKFYKDGTYQMLKGTGNYNGSYKRNGFIIDGICEDITGSHKWLVYNGKLIDRFFIADGASYEQSQRAKYEFYKYMIDIEEGGALKRYIEREFIREYEKTHPISLSK